MPEERTDAAARSPSQSIRDDGTADAQRSGQQPPAEGPAAEDSRHAAMDVADGQPQSTGDSGEQRQAVASPQTVMAAEAALPDSETAVLAALQSDGGVAPSAKALAAGTSSAAAASAAVAAGASADEQPVLDAEGTVQDTAPAQQLRDAAVRAARTPLPGQPVAAHGAHAEGRPIDKISGAAQTPLDVPRVLPGTASAVAVDASLASDAQRGAVAAGVQLSTRAGTSAAANGTESGLASATADRLSAAMRAESAGEPAQWASAREGARESVLLATATAAQQTAEPLARANMASPAEAAVVAPAPAAGPVAVAAGSGAPLTGSPTTTPEYALQYAPQDAEFAEEVSARLQTLVRDGIREARLQLHPAELGRLQVTITTDGDQARVAFLADSSAAREAIELSLPRLREMLEQNGLNLAQSDVGERDFGAPSGSGDGDSLAADQSEAESEERLSGDVEAVGAMADVSLSGRIDTFI